MNSEPSSPTVKFLTVDENHAGQRLDNYLLTRLKGVPKSRIYRIIRKGEVRVNMKRAKPEYKLKLNDSVRIPPVRVAERGSVQKPSGQLLKLVSDSLLREDDDLLIFNKPSGLAVHGGTGIKVGLIDVVRLLYPRAPFLELVHRLDKGTSGCILIARNSVSLQCLTKQLKRKQVTKHYHAIVEGNWPAHVLEVNACLYKPPARSGERKVEISAQGKEARTCFRALRKLGAYTLVEATPVTGRTHQIRVHASSVGHAIAGDEKYNTPDNNSRLQKTGINRLCLHAFALDFVLPDGSCARIEAPYDASFQTAVNLLSQAVD